MSQKRNKTGVDFEKSICEEKNWLQDSSSPKLFWSGEGRYNFQKIQSVCLDPKKFYPILEKSNFEKYDAIDENLNKVEMKKYTIKQAKKWNLYSEPIFKIANRSQLKTVSRVFGSNYVENYNKFLDGVKDNIGEDILRRIVRTSIGIQFIDGFVKKEDIEFKWEVKKSWKGFNRLTIMFRVK